MDLVKRDGVEVDICKEHGVWLDDGELQVVLSKARRRGRGTRGSVARARRRGVIKGLFWGVWAFLDEDSGGARSRNTQLPAKSLDIGSAADNAGLVPQTERQCPVCEQRMTIESKNDVIINCCPDHGTWIDGNQLERMTSKARHRSRLKTRANQRRAHRDGAIDANLFGLFALFR